MRAAVDTTVVCGDAEPADYAPTPNDLLASLRQRRSVVASGEADILAIAVEWAHTHPELDLEGNQLWWRPGKRGQAYAEKLKTAMHEDGSPVAAGKAVELEDIEWFAIPMIAWDAAAPFAAANGMPTASGKALIRDALILHHRLPLIYQQVKTGLMPAWKARQVAQACIGKPDDVVSDLDERFADLAGTHGLVTVQRMLAEAMLRLYPDQAEVERLEKLDRRRVELNELDDTPTTGLAELVACGDWLDLQDFEAPWLRSPRRLSTPTTPGPSPSTSDEP